MSPGSPHETNFDGYTMQSFNKPFTGETHRNYQSTIRSPTSPSTNQAPYDPTQLQLPIPHAYPGNNQFFSQQYNMSNYVPHPLISTDEMESSMYTHRPTNTMANMDFRSTDVWGPDPAFHGVENKLQPPLNTVIHPGQFLGSVSDNILKNRNPISTPASTVAQGYKMNSSFENSNPTAQFGESPVDRYLNHYADAVSLLKELLEFEPTIWNIYKFCDYIRNNQELRNYLEMERQYGNKVATSDGYFVEEFYRYLREFPRSELQNVYDSLLPAVKIVEKWIKVIGEPVKEHLPLRTWENNLNEGNVSTEDQLRSDTGTFNYDQTVHKDNVVFDASGRNNLNVARDWEKMQNERETATAATTATATTGTRTENEIQMSPTSIVGNKLPNFYTHLQTPKWKGFPGELLPLQVEPLKPVANQFVTNFQPQGVLHPDLSVKSKTICRQCGSTDTPEWRKGPEDARTLCNACGLFYNKLIKKIGTERAIKELAKRRQEGDSSNRRISSTDFLH
ncbi:Gat4 protein [Martiniozyma asiatica (nom. inval.)]|nr:Gat4 protein [Martiniozyma asiatica]